MTADNKLRAWVLDQLTNNEAASDAELVDYFSTEGPMPREQAQALVKYRLIGILHGGIA